MTTFYLDGCQNSNDDTIRYFEDRYFTIEKIIDADNGFQMAMEMLVSTDPDDSLEEEEYLMFLDSLQQKYQQLSRRVEAAAGNKLPAMDDDENLDRAYRALIDAYRNTTKREYKQMTDLLKDTPDDADSLFNEYNRSASDVLEEKVRLFFEAVEAFSQKKGVEINWKDNE